MALISSIKLPNNIEYDLYAKTAGDAATVTGHTVATDVPANAVFTDTVLDWVKDVPSSTATQAVIIGDVTNNTASGNYSIAIGYNTTASGSQAIATGWNTVASGMRSHAEGEQTQATGGRSHAEGSQTTASETAAHSEGVLTVASGTAAHSEGRLSVASGTLAHAEGDYTVANHRAQHTFGAFNLADTSVEASTARGTYIEIAGNGADNDNRSNARTLDWNGNEWLAGDLTVEGNLNGNVVGTINGHTVAADVPADAEFTDSYVLQSASSTAGWRKVLLRNDYATQMDAAFTNATGRVYSTVSVEVKPSINQLKATSFNVDGQAVISYDSTEDAILFTFN